MQFLKVVFIISTVWSASAFALTSCQRPIAGFCSHEVATPKLYMTLVSPDDDEEATYAPLEIDVADEKDGRGEKLVSFSPASLRKGAPM
jgi:hypothetical protein